MLTQLLFLVGKQVVPGIILSEDVVAGQQFETLQGCVLTLTEDGGNFFINEAQILDADILAENGVIHVISSVLMPGDDCATLPATPVTEAPTEPVVEETDPVEVTDPVVVTDVPVVVTDAPEPVLPTAVPETQPNVTEPEIDVPEPVNPIEPDDMETNTTEAPEEEDRETPPIEEDSSETDSSALMRGIASTVILPFLLLLA